MRIGKNETGTLFIMGNGFDLNLGLKTSYKHFIDRMKQIKAMQQNQLFKSMLEQYKDTNWIDIELFLKYYATKLTRGEIKNEHWEKEFNELSKELGDYMLADIIYSESDKRNAQDSLAGKIFRAITSSQNNHIVSFNYTTKERLCDLLGIADEFNIDYVHGEYMNGVVIGYEYDKNIDSKYNIMIKSTNHFHKSCNISHLLLSYNNIIIFGHSLGETDHHYFRKFFITQSNSDSENYKHKNITLFTKDSNSRSKIYAEISRMDNSVNIDYLKDINNIRVFYTSDAKDKQIDRFIEELYNSSKK